MKSFLSDDFILENDSARALYHDFAAKMPIIDYHCHLPPDEIANDHVFDNITKVWLQGDHYKWRAMRTNGVNERFITGDSTDREKFQHWAETVPYTMRNPLYHWTHLELKNPFGLQTVLNGNNAGEVYDHCSSKLASGELSVRNLLSHFNVKVVCTTDDPADSLEHHKKIKADGFAVKILPTFRPDKAMAVENTASYNAYIDRLGLVADVDIRNFTQLMEVIQKRHQYFHVMGCRLSDHGLETMYAEDFTEIEMGRIFSKIRGGLALQAEEILVFKSGMLYHFAVLDHAKGWTQQFHLGAIRNNNSRMQSLLGADSGFDSIGDFDMGVSMARFFDRLDSTDQLAKTIIYNLNPRDNELFATMIGNFQDGSVAGKMQFGSSWWFLDQKDGMEKQIDALSNLGLVSRFVGMLTDSRSFLSFSRHEYFRRILCNKFGKDIENGELPNDQAWIGQLIQNICYNNANQYFGF